MRNIINNEHNNKNVSNVINKPPIMTTVYQGSRKGAMKNQKKHLVHLPIQHQSVVGFIFS